MRKCFLFCLALCAGCLCMPLNAGCGKREPLTAEQWRVKQEQQAEFLRSLEAARFAGHAYLHMEGSPFALHMTESVELGAKQSRMGFDGNVDFTKPPRVPEPVQ